MSTRQTKCWPCPQQQRPRPKQPCSPLARLALPNTFCRGRARVGHGQKVRSSRGGSAEHVCEGGCSPNLPAGLQPKQATPGRPAAFIYLLIYQLESGGSVCLPPANRRLLNQEVAARLVVGSGPACTGEGARRLSTRALPCIRRRSLGQCRWACTMLPCRVRPWAPRLHAAACRGSSHTAAAAQDGLAPSPVVTLPTRTRVR